MKGDRPDRPAAREVSLDASQVLRRPLLPLDNIRQLLGMENAVSVDLPMSAKVATIEEDFRYFIDVLRGLEYHVVADSWLDSWRSIPDLCSELATGADATQAFPGPPRLPSGAEAIARDAETALMLLALLRSRSTPLGVTRAEWQYGLASLVGSLRERVMFWPYEAAIRRGFERLRSERAFAGNRGDRALKARVLAEAARLQREAVRSGHSAYSTHKLATLLLLWLERSGLPMRAESTIRHWLAANAGIP